MGIEVVKERIGSTYGYHVISKQLETAELKLLVDATDRYPTNYRLYLKETS